MPVDPTTAESTIRALQPAADAYEKSKKGDPVQRQRDRYYGADHLEREPQLRMSCDAQAELQI